VFSPVSFGKGRYSPRDHRKNAMIIKQKNRAQSNGQKGEREKNLLCELCG